MNFSTELSIWAIAAALGAMAIGTTNAENDPSCASNLVACLPYLNSTSKPSPLCCIPLKKVIEDEFQCLCNLYNSDEFSGGNVTQALTLPARCGITTDLSVCGTTQPPGPSTSPSPTGTPGSGTPPSGPGTGTGPSPGGAVKSIASSTGFLVMVFFWVSIILN